MVQGHALLGGRGTVEGSDHRVETNPSRSIARDAPRSSTMIDGGGSGEKICGAGIV